MTSKITDKIPDGAKRLLRAAEVVEKADESKFSMREFGWVTGEKGALCSTPACVLGYYCTLPESPWELVVRVSREAPWPKEKGGEFLDGWNDLSVLEHFEIDDDEAEDLFGGFGCGEATTGRDAAAFIRKFVKRKWGVEANEEDRG